MSRSWRGSSEQRIKKIADGYHLNKRHWNTVALDGSLPDAMIIDLIEDSYDLVVSKLPKAHRRAIGWRGEDA